MKVELLDYNIGTQSGDALVLVYDEFVEVIFDGTVNFEFSLDNLKITDIEFFDTENRRIKPKHEIKEAIEYCLIEKIKDNEE